MTHENNPGGHDGPIEGEFVWLCYTSLRRCKHLGFHNGHYPYCSAQPSPNNDGSTERYYPWPGAGKHIFDPKPNSGCPYISATPRKGEGET